MKYPCDAALPPLRTRPGRQPREPRRYSPATAIPLIYGCRRCVLVGDPAQLPPTVLSPRAARSGLQRSLFERLEAKLERHNGQLLRAAVELAKDWRTDKYLRNLEAMMIVADKEVTLVITGNGDVLEPMGGIAAIGSGGNFALSAARALAEYEKDPAVLARKAMEVAADICVYTNDQFTQELIEIQA